MAQERKGREWVILADDFETDGDFRSAVEQDLVDIFPMANRGGRGVIVAPLRVQDDTGVYFTAGFAFEEVFMPAVRQREPEQRDDRMTAEAQAHVARAVAESEAQRAAEPEPVEA